MRHGETRLYTVHLLLQLSTELFWSSVVVFLYYLVLHHNKPFKRLGVLYTHTHTHKQHRKNEITVHSPLIISTIILDLNYAQISLYCFEYHTISINLIPCIYLYKMPWRISIWNNFVFTIIASVLKRGEKEEQWKTKGIESSITY